MASTNGVAAAFLFGVFTLAETAAYLKLPESEVRAEAEAGRLLGRAFGDDWQFIRVAVLKWLRTNRLASH